MRSVCLTISILICLCAHAARAQYSFGGIRSYERYHRQYWNQFYKAKESGKDLNYFLRAEIAFGYVLGEGIFHLHNHVDDADTKYYYDTTVSIITRPKYALAINENSGYPIMATGKSSAVIFTYGLTGRLSRYDLPSIKLGNYTTNFIFSNVDIGVPIGIDFKSGGEAMLDKTKRFCFTLGAGLEGLWVSGNMNRQTTYSKAGFAPFMKAEFGFLTGFAGFKLRASYMGGSYTYFQAEDVANGSQVKLSNDNQFTISLVILEMVKQWEE